MDLRTTTNPMVRWTGRALEAANARHPWNHNDHFHRWILRSLPVGARRVLDVGCGRGALVAALHERLGGDALVVGIDPDARMALRAAERFRGTEGVRIRRASLADIAREGGPYDALTLVASLHHMDLGTALVQARDLLRPGGRLLIVTLVRPDGALDTVWDVVCAVTNPLIGLVKHPRRAHGPVGDGAMPVQDPAASIAELRERAQELLPGARIRRRVGFRVTLCWTKPV
ncbi:class I SAM-dependent methyltransferase [Brachybacterium sp. DNPG3]